MLEREAPAAESADRDRRACLAELQAWYLDDLRPKLAGAAGAGTVAPAAAAALDLQLRDLLSLPGNFSEEAA